MNNQKSILAHPMVRVHNSPEGFRVSTEEKTPEEGVLIYRITISADVAIEPSAMTLKWKLPALNIKGVWKSGSLHEKRLQYDWELDHLQSRISVDAPAVCVFGYDDQNVINFACSDAVNLIDLNALLREEDNHLYCHVTFFKERHPAIKFYEAEIRIDTRFKAYDEAIGEIANWWTTFENLKPAPVPELARSPLYSTWYQFHQELDQNILIEECALAKQMGYDLIIIDDGWQTMDTNRGYDYTGDWEPDRFPDMKSFINSLQATGIKVGLWFSVPFCGKYSKAYQKFKGKFLTEAHRWAPVFDPRYPEVRQHLIDIYKKAVKEWELDAVKLDFIDDFKVYESTVLTKEGGRDYANVNAAVHRLLTDATDALRALKPGIAIEFRQRYIGPAMRKFGNMFRAFDCPNDPISNRIRTTDVKLLCGNTAVHSDMITWHDDEPVTISALQVLNGIFAVPQMSVHLRLLPEAHRNMIQFYTHYWTEHKEILLDGNFSAHDPLANFSMLSSEKDGHLIVGLYLDQTIKINDSETIDVLNAKTSEEIVILPQYSGVAYEISIWNCEGKLIKQESEQVLEVCHLFSVPVSGMLRLKKKAAQT